MKKGKTKHKAVLVLNEGPCHENVTEKSCMSVGPRILNPDREYGRKVSYTLRASRKEQETLAHNTSTEQFYLSEILNSKICLQKGSLK
jgi:hypothetical protein